ncbi:unnamed protein product [Sphagnum balticum]
MARSWGDSRIVNQHEGFAAAISQQLQSQGSHVRVSAAPGVCSRQDAAARGCTRMPSAASAVGGGRQFAQVQQQQQQQLQRRHAESSNHVLMGRSHEMDISLPLYWESMVRSCRSSLDALEFEFNENLPEKNDDCIFSPATTSHYDSSSHVCQPRYYSKFLCMKSPLHSAPALETVALQNSRSSSFRSQSSSIAWETSGDMKISEAGDNSSSSSSSPEQDSTAWSVRRDSGSSNGCKQEEPVHRSASTEEEPNSYSKSSNPEISWTSTLSTTLLRSWKALFGTKKKKKSSSSKRRSREHTEETTTCSAPMQKITVAAPLSAACKSSERLRGKKSHPSTIPYVGEEAPQLFAAPAAATPGASGTAAEKERTLRLLMRESSLHSHIHNSPSAVLLPAKGSSSNTSQAQKQQPNLMQSLSTMPATTSASPGGGRRRRRLQLQEEEEEEEEDCATPKLQSSSRERWKKYVKKILMSPHTDPQQQQQQLQLQQQQQNKIDNRIRVTTTTTVASSLGAATPVATPPANTPLGTPSRKALPKLQGSSSSESSTKSTLPTLKLQGSSSSESSTKPTLPTLKLQGSSSASSSSSSEFSSTKPALPTLKLLQGSSSESSSTTKLAAATSKIARIVASTVMTPRSKAKFNLRNPSCSNGGVVVASPAAINHNNNNSSSSMTLSEQHNAVQGAIAHCKQSHSREEEHSNFLHSKTRVVNKT